jgi:hypothetical protein
MTNQHKAWQGDFGRAYTERNVVDWRVRYLAFQQMLGGMSIGRALEVGCNRGHNLVALSQLFGEECSLVGIEPNAYALGLAQPATPYAELLQTSIYSLPVRDQYFDLMLTAGVLNPYSSGLPPFRSGGDLPGEPALHPGCGVLCRGRDCYSLPGAR